MFPLDPNQPAKRSLEEAVQAQEAMLTASMTPEAWMHLTPAQLERWAATGRLD